MVRVPELRYIQTLITGRHNASLLIDELTSLKIPVPANDLKIIYADLVNSNTQYFGDPSYPPPEHDWLVSFQMSPMYYYRFAKPIPDGVNLQGCAQAIHMLEDPKLVKYINTLLLANIPINDIELILNAKYNISYESKDFEMFERYFANYSTWSYTDKDIFINSLINEDYRRAYRSAITNERSQIIWELGLGTDPTASFETMLRDMFTDSYFLFKKNLKFNTEDAQRFAHLAIKLSDRMDHLDEKNKDENDLFSELKINLQTQSTQKKSSNPSGAIIDMEELGDLISKPETPKENIVDLETLMNITEEGK
jgi:hypothetical protein